MGSKGSDSEECFAATPPIEALRALISHSMSGPKKRAFMVCDDSRAFFHAPLQHEIFVELCEEAKKTVEDGGVCMCGTKACEMSWSLSWKINTAALGRRTRDVEGGGGVE